MWRVKTVTKFKNSFFPVLIYWNDNRIHLGIIKKLNFPIWFPPPTNIPQKMSDYLPYGKLNEGVKHVDIGVSVAFPETEVKGCSVHLASHDDIWANTRKQLVDDKR